MRNRVLILGLSVIIYFVSYELQAAGIGMYGMFGYGSTSLDQHIKPLLFYRKYGNYIAGGGLVIDTNCSGPGIFNYRITIGAMRTFDAVKRESVLPHMTTRTQFVNTFGLGIVRQESFRLWIGPQVGLSLLNGIYKGNRNNMLAVYGGGLSINLNYIDKLQYSMIGGTFGIALGMNLNFKRNITMLIEGSWRYDVYYGMYRRDYFIGFEKVSFSKWVDGYADGLYLSLGIMYRMSEPAAENADNNTVGQK